MPNYNNPLDKFRSHLTFPIIQLTGYGKGIIGNVKCVLLSYRWNWSPEVDWIHTLGGAADKTAVELAALKAKYGQLTSGSENFSESILFPVIGELSLELKETYSPNEYSNFDLIAYKNGDLSGAFSND